MSHKGAGQQHVKVPKQRELCGGWEGRQPRFWRGPPEWREERGEARRQAVTLLATETTMTIAHGNGAFQLHDTRLKQVHLPAGSRHSGPKIVFGFVGRLQLTFQSSDHRHRPNASTLQRLNTVEGRNLRVSGEARISVGAPLTLACTGETGGGGGEAAETWGKTAGGARGGTGAGRGVAGSGGGRKAAGEGGSGM